MTAAAPALPFLAEPAEPAEARSWLDTAPYPGYPASMPDPAPYRRGLVAVPAQTDPRRCGAAVPDSGSDSVASSVAVLHAPAGRPVAPPVRLTRRGVVVLTALVAALGAVLVWVAAESASPAPGANSVPSGSVVTVRGGDTLWSIATSVAPGRDPRAEVAALQRVNRLTGVDIEPGQHLRVP